MDALEDEELPSDQQQENEGTAKAFASLISTMGQAKNRPSVTKFVKRMDDILEISLPPALPCRAALSLAKHGLMGQFTRLWPSPKTVQKWVERN